MKKYNVYANVTVTKFVGTFEAESEEDAVEKGMDNPECCADQLCHYCSRKYDVGDVDEVFAEEVKE